MIASLQVGSISERFLCLCNIYIYIIFCLSGRYQYGNIVSVGFQIICLKKSTGKRAVIYDYYRYVTYVLDT